jgi:uncharacterized membrane protein HdeD (DUF308 family)
MSSSSPGLMNPGMLENLRVNWGWIALRGGAAIAFGVMAILWPGITLAALVLLWGAYAIADGVLSLVAAFRVHDSGRPYWAFLLEGFLGIGAGIIAFTWPAITALMLLMLIACWAIVMGIFQVFAAVRMRKEIEHEWLLGLSGIVSVLFGALMIFQPGAGALALIWTIAGYAIFFGALLVVLGLRLRSYTHHRLARV